MHPAPASALHLGISLIFLPFSQEWGTVPAGHSLVTGDNVVSPSIAAAAVAAMGVVEAPSHTAAAGAAGVVVQLRALALLEVDTTLKAAPRAGVAVVVEARVLSPLTLALVVWLHALC